MQHQSSTQLFKYWNEVRDGQFAPNRFEIEPSQIADILPDIFILECPDNATYRFRLAGTRICTSMGHEMRGINLLSYWKPDEREAAQNLLYNVAQDGAGAVIEFECSNPQGDRVSFELLALPLVQSGDTVNRMIGSMCAFNNPYWLGGVELHELSLKSFKLIWPDMKPGILDPLEVPAILSRHDAPTAGGAKTRFRVVEGGLSQRAK